MADTTLKTYLDYSLPVDLRSVRVMPDVDVSYAIGSSLVSFDEGGQVVANLAISWKTGPDWIEFQIHPGAKWSDGSPITPSEVIESFADTKKNYQKQIPSLFESYVSLSSHGERGVRFHLKAGIKVGFILHKLVEPMHGIVKIVNDKASTSITSGPYYVKSVSETEMILRANIHFVHYSPEMYQEIHLRPSQAQLSAQTLLGDTWPDYVSVTSVLLREDMKKLPSSISLWRRNCDRLVNISYSGEGRLEETRTLFGYLRAHSDLSRISALVDAASPATQIYAKGFILYSAKEPTTPVVGKMELAKVWKDQPLRIAYIKDRMPEAILAAVEKNLCSVLPMKCIFVPIKLNELMSREIAKCDVRLATVGVDSLNLDGGLSYYFEMNPPWIPSDETEKGNFVRRMKEIRSSHLVPVPLYRDLLFDAVDGNYILPLFHFSTTAIGRSNVDFSKVPPVYEVVPFHLIRHKK